jgi:predicted component of type VI protein secretion system
MIVELVVTQGPHAGRSFRFAEHATFIVGRSTQAHFSLPEKDPHVSRLHVLIEVNPPLCRLRNMSAVNGTLVNGTKVEQADLNDGDTITIGVTELTVRLFTPAVGDAIPTLGLPATPPSASVPVRERARVVQTHFAKRPRVDHDTPPRPTRTARNGVPPLASTRPSHAVPRLPRLRHRPEGVRGLTLHWSRSRRD